MEYDSVSFKTGLVIAALSRGKLPKSEPVAFLYNGVKLPGLPVVEGFDKAFIRKHPYFGGAYSLYCFSEIEYVKHDDNTQNIVCNATNCRYFDNLDNAGESVVDHWASYRVDEGSVAFQNWAIWSNFTMYNLDGSVCMEASDPVPVYE